MHPVAPWSGRVLRLAGLAVLCSTGAAFHMSPGFLTPARSALGVGAGGRLCVKRGARVGRGCIVRMEGSKPGGVDSARASLKGTDSDPDEEDAPDEYGMSMISGLDQDLTKDTDTVRIFGASLPSKFASRGRGLRSYDEEKVDPALMATILAENGNDLEAAKLALQENGRISELAEEMFRMGVKYMQVPPPRHVVLLDLPAPDAAHMLCTTSLSRHEPHSGL